MLTSAHILTIPSDLERFTFYIDASKYGLDAVLMQHGNIVVYASTQLKEHEKNYAMHNLQLAAVVFPRKIWRYYMHCFKCEIFSYLKEWNMRQKRW